MFQSNSCKFGSMYRFLHLKIKTSRLPVSKTMSPHVLFSATDVDPGVLFKYVLSVFFPANNGSQQHTSLRTLLLMIKLHFKADLIKM